MSATRALDTANVPVDRATKQQREQKTEQSQVSTKCEQQSVSSQTVRHETLCMAATYDGIVAHMHSIPSSSGSCIYTHILAFSYIHMYIVHVQLVCYITQSLWAFGSTAALTGGI